VLQPKHIAIAPLLQRVGIEPVDGYYTERVSRLSTWEEWPILNERSFRRFIERCHPKRRLGEPSKRTFVSLIWLAPSQYETIYLSDCFCIFNLYQKPSKESCIIRFGQTCLFSVFFDEALSLVAPHGDKSTQGPWHF
jgi:hypothetical protein